ncbi:MAG: cyclic nucleotide-binding domain-containing protein [Minicystis sp.]
MRPDADTVGRAAIFESLGSADRDALALCFRGRAYAPGEVVFLEGDPGTSLFLVGQGTFLAVSRAGGVPREIGRFGPGQVIDPTAIVLRGRRPATVTAVGPAVAHELDAEAIALLRAGAPSAARAVMTAGITGLIKQLRDVEMRVERELDRTGNP